MAKKAKVMENQRQIPKSSLKHAKVWGLHQC